MSDKSSTSQEVVIKEYPTSTLWLDGNQVKAVGNLILTNRRLVFLRQTDLTEKEVEKLQEMSREANTERIIQFALSLHKRNWQLSLSSVVSAKLGLRSIFPIPQTYMRVFYRTTGKKIKTLSFFFKTSFLRRFFRSEFPTLGWIRTINQAVKAQLGG